MTSKPSAVHAALQRAGMRVVPLLVLALVLLGGAAARGQTNDMALVKTRIRDSLNTGLASAATILDYRSTLQTNGTWPDLDYASTAIAYWPPRTHLDRLKAMAKEYAWGALAGDAALLADILRAYDAWILLDPQSPNWWYQAIGTPQALGEILIVLEAVMSPSRMTAGLALVARAYVPRATNSGTNTGANRVDRAYATMMRGLLLGDAALTTESFLAIGDTILVNSAHQFAEGIQADGSFQQHGAQLYVAGYGYGFIQGVLRYASFGSGTVFRYEDRQRRVMLDYLLDTQWFVRGNTIDYSSTGRAISRSGSSSSALGFRGMLSNALAVSAGYRQADLETYQTRLQVVNSNGVADSASALTGNRNFWRSDFVIHHRPEFSISVKTSSTRTLQPESGNGEGLKNLHLGDGVTFIQRTGNEYDEIMPVWDWRRIPGTTVEQGTYSLKPSADWGVAGTSKHAGGASDGTNGMAVFDYSRLGVAAKKSWFFLGDVMVALGASLAAPSASNAVLTTVNQTLRTGAVTYRAAAGTGVVTGTTSPAGLQWVHHDGVGYLLPAPASNVVISSLLQTGAWQLINSGLSPDPVQRDVFSLHFNHGTGFTSGTYAYLVAPGLTPAQVDAFPVGDYEILRNDGTAQAVRHAATGQTLASFWGAATAGSITADNKACVILREDADFIDVAVSDPTQTNNGSILVNLSLPAAGLIRADGPLSVEQLTPNVRVRLATTKSYGRTFRARFFRRTNAFETLSIPATADSFVHDAVPGTNFGTFTNLAVKLLSNTSNYTREAFLGFAVPTQGRTPVAASLRLSPVSVQTAGLQGVHPVAPGAWTEMGLTWTNRPFPAGPASSVWLPALGARISTDVLPILLAQGSTNLEVIVTTHAPTSDGFVYYVSREGPGTALRPALEVVVPRPEFDIWRMEHFGAAATNAVIAGDGADPDWDGIPNALEFVLGSPPGSPSTHLLPTVGVDASVIQFAFRRSRAAADAPIVVECSEDLSTWTPAVDGENGVAVQVAADPDEPGLDRVTVNIPRPATGRCFVRLHVGNLDSNFP